MKKIKLTKGNYAIVDDEDYPVLSRFSWFDSNGMLGTDISILTGKVRIPISKFIYGQSKKTTLNVGRLKAKYLNGNYFDCRKENMIMVSFSRHNGMKGKENGPNREYSSIYRGVSLQKNTGRWYACINIDNKKVGGKAFLTEDEAALHWNKLARKHFGETAYQNKIEE